MMRAVTTPAATPPPAIADVLLEGEQVLWTGRPRQSLLVREDLLCLPLSIAFFLAGLYVFGFVRFGPYPQWVAVGGGAVASGAATLFASRIWIMPRRRWRTCYAVTNVRALIVES